MEEVFSSGRLLAQASSLKLIDRKLRGSAAPREKIGCPETKSEVRRSASSMPGGRLE